MNIVIINRQGERRTVHDVARREQDGQALRLYNTRGQLVEQIPNSELNSFLEEG
jgi:hypothetical protein